MRVAIEQRFGPLEEWRCRSGLFTGLAALGLVVLVVLALTTDRFLSVENIKAILSRLDRRDHGARPHLHHPDRLAGLAGDRARPR